jgi:murein DD-endopeptidase MepM/ murein hydrolase activator NlpD
LHNIKRTYLLIIILCLLSAVSFLGAVNYQTHKVRKGETLYSLSKRYDVTVEQLKKYNNLKGNNLAVGQKLKVKPIEPKPKPKPVIETPPVTAAKPPVTTPGTVPTLEVTNKALASGTLPDEYYHEVKPKENLYRIALNANIPLADLLKFNDFPDDKVVIKPGQKLIIKDPTSFQPVAITKPVETVEQPEPIPTDNVSDESDSVAIEKVYIVQRKDTLFRIAKENNMTVEQLKKLNNLKSNSLHVGQKIYIIAPRGGITTKPPTQVVSEEDLKSKSKIRKDLVMPVDGRAISEYGIRNGRPHKGIDLAASNGMPVYAVLDGTIVYSGLQGSYGNVVVIEHPDYVMTVYGHNEKNLVAVGDIVKQGQVIATVGSTGNATCPHVHFEYRIKGKAINPRRVLPFE